MRKLNKSPKQCSKICPFHFFDVHETEVLQKNLLEWYDCSKRILPWRTIASTETDVNKRIYAVWVSEVMLQQTQVAAVVEYFKKWICLWPTVQSLSLASLQEVNEVWTGLGYYSRARRLHEAAVKVAKELNGNFPTCRDSLMRELPGVGKYTASAIASIALANAVGVVDGNASRVLSRLRGIGSEVTLPAVTDHLWGIADGIVSKERPGDFNQALMEFGATVCTPKNPSCDSCPIRSLCVAHKKSQSDHHKISVTEHIKRHGCKGMMTAHDLECDPECDMCLLKSAWDKSLGVLNYPRKRPKTKVRSRTSVVLIIPRLTDWSVEYLLVQRPKTGLLANLLEFPSLEVQEEMEKEEVNCTSRDFLHNGFGVAKNCIGSLTHVDTVLHIFSHIRQHYKIYETSISVFPESTTVPSHYQGMRWLSAEDFLSSATSAAMKKVFKAYEAFKTKHVLQQNEATLANSGLQCSKKQKTIDHYFTSGRR